MPSRAPDSASRPLGLPQGLTELERGNRSQRSAVVGGVTNFGLATLQIVIGVVTNSQGLIADGFHSLADLIGDLVVLSAARASQDPPDVEHPYGHLRFENAATMLLSALLIGAAGGIAWHSLLLLQVGYGLAPVGRAALVVAGIALLVKETLFRYLLGVAHHVRSSMLEANAWHARSDALSSIVVAVGIVGNLLGATILDPLAAIIVAAMLLKMGWTYGRSAFDALTDRAIDPATSEAIRRTLAATPGVISIHELRTRQTGDQIVGDAHVQVAARVSVSEGHQIAEAAVQRVKTTHGLSDFLVHIDAEDDLAVADASFAPARAVILDSLRAELGLGLELLDSSPLHFLDGQVDADLLLRDRASDEGQSVQRFEQGIADLKSRLPWLRQVRIFVQFDR